MFGGMGGVSNLYLWELCIPALWGNVCGGSFDDYLQKW